MNYDKFGIIEFTFNQLIENISEKFLTEIKWVLNEYIINVFSLTFK